MNVSSYLLYQKQTIEKEKESLDSKYQKMSIQLKNLEGITEFIRNRFYYEESTEPEVRRLSDSCWLEMFIWLPLETFQKELCHKHRGYKIKTITDNSYDLYLTIEKDSVLYNVLVWKYIGLIGQYIKLNIL